ncbi:sigma-70 family RNA polymerase sigma factor [Nostocaceae cyanobacterium CENA369]|uniref:Sigma-70 family RNA polymerase sigma factor n=1 Tax=Dendronalium phyllosphericum CENA369 TaxID=1725256 RepID=A0A8J7LHJ1_9NOST|nr:sigma-70 family RNA polymerase sigma factor [Dendronalium phyllosphericum]MBH8578137.1 sigma-70 family RNA polymerase sigma factor [Dendronalium phyllosphericum CENA369]
MTNDSSRKQLDAQLKELALIAQLHSGLSKERRMALTQLINTIWLSGKLCRPYSGQFPMNYEDIYEEAVQNLFFYLCQDNNISKYDSERGEFLTWINVLLSKRFFPEAIPKIIGKKNEISLEKSHIENLSFTESVSLFDQIIQCIEDDPEGIFIKEHIKNHPEVNFQAIAKRRYSGVSWKNISQEWGIGITTLNTFFQRCVKKFAPLLQEYL